VVTLRVWTCRWNRRRFAFVDDAGLIVREARVTSEPEALIAFFATSGMAKDGLVSRHAC